MASPAALAESIPALKHFRAERWAKPTKQRQERKQDVKQSCGGDVLSSTRTSSTSSASVRPRLSAGKDQAQRLLGEHAAEAEKITHERGRGHLLQIPPK